MTRLSGRHFALGFKGLAAAPGLDGKVAFLRRAAARGLYLLIRSELEASQGGGAAGKLDRALLDALTVAADLETMDERALPVALTAARAPTFNLLTPLMTPGSFFGGYRAFGMFAAALQQAGGRVRFVATDAIEGDKNALVDACRRRFPDLARVFETAEIADAVGRSPAALAVSEGDVFVAFNCAGAHIATNTAKAFAPGRPFVFFIQDEEGHFHPHDSYRAWKLDSYRLAHVGIYNSPWLQAYFDHHQLGPFAANAQVRGALSFRHALDAGPLPSAAALGARRPRKLLFWARPEPHTARNLFELGLVVLRKACACDLFPAGDWELEAIGCNQYPDLELPRGQRLRFLGRLPLEAYQEALPRYDVGLVLMFSPHPSVPNFELAASGVPTVTTGFENRPASAMEAACPNLIGATAGVDALVQALGLAKVRALNAEERLRRAEFDWPRRWQDTFDDAWLTRFRALLGEAMGQDVASALFETPA